MRFRCTPVKKGTLKTVFSPFILFCFFFFFLTGNKDGSTKRREKWPGEVWGSSVVGAGLCWAADSPRPAVPAAGSCRRTMRQAPAAPSYSPRRGGLVRLRKVTKDAVNKCRVRGQVQARRHSFNCHPLLLWEKWHCGVLSHLSEPAPRPAWLLRSGTAGCADGSLVLLLWF